MPIPSKEIRSALLDAVQFAGHTFGTRAGPLSQDRMAGLKQIHSARCLRAAGPGCAGEGDALITNLPGLAISIRTADCFPILLADPRNGAVAAIHAGWRGTASWIVEGTIRQMRVEFGTVPNDVRAAIGPGIGGCCYEVGQEVARQFGRDAAARIDLAEANRAQLIESGVPADQIDVLGLCTFCDPSLFHSYRRDKDRAGRMISYIRAPGIVSWESPVRQGGGS